MDANQIAAPFREVARRYDVAVPGWPLKASAVFQDFERAVEGEEKR